MCRPKIIKIAALVAIAAIFAGNIAGCGEKEKSKTETANGAVSIDNITEGIYVMTSDGKFYAPNTDGQNFTSSATSADPSRIIFSRDDKKNVPVLYKDDHLVYFTTKQIPNNMTIEEFTDAGYTFGLYGITQKNGNYEFKTNNFIPGSTLEASFNGFLNNTDTASIITIGDKKITAGDITKAGTVLCEKYGEKQTMGFMRGTFYNEVETIADEHVWYSSETGQIANYELTKNGFIVLTLPASIEDGDFVSVMGTGLIHVSGDKRADAENVETEEGKN